MVLGVAFGGVAVAAASVAFLPRAFLPPFNEGTLIINVTFQPGISLTESDRAGPRGRTAADGGAGGEGASAAAPAAPSSTSMRRACIPPNSTSTCARAGGRVPRCWPISARASPSCRRRSTSASRSAHRLDHMLSGVRAQIALKIFGDDLDTLRTLAETLRGAAGGERAGPGRPADREARCASRSCEIARRLRARRRSTASQPAALTETLELLSNGRRRRRQIVDGSAALRRGGAPGRRATAPRPRLAELLVQTPHGLHPARG